MNKMNRAKTNRSLAIYLLMCFSFLPLTLEGQEKNDLGLRDTSKQTKPMAVSQQQAKIYQRNSQSLVVQLKTENGPWKNYSMNPGTYIISLKDCGLPDDQLCEKIFRVRTSGNSFDEAKLEGGSRYQIYWDRKGRRWVIRKL